MITTNTRALPLLLIFPYLLILVPLAHADCPPRFGPIDPPSTRIVAAPAASENLYKSVVAVYSSDPENPTLLCTATLVAPDWLLTAASCPITAGARVLYNVPDVAEATEEDFVRIKDVFRSPRYDSSTAADADIAVAQLVGSLDKPEPLRINVQPPIPVSQVYVRVVGFGSADREDPQAGAGVMRQADIPVLDDDKCRDLDLDPPIDRNMQTCAGFLEDGACGPCWRDRGAPVLQYSADDESRPVIVGIVSRFACEAAAAHTFTRTAAFTNWLDQVSKDKEFNYVSFRADVIRVSVSKPLSTGVIVGIAIAGAAALLIVAILFCLLVLHRRRRIRKMPVYETPAIPFKTNSARPAIEQGNIDQRNALPEGPGRGNNGGAVTSPPWNPRSNDSPAPQGSSPHSFVVPARAPAQAPHVAEVLPSAENAQHTPAQYSDQQQQLPQQQHEHSGFVAPNPSPAQTPGNAPW